MPNNPLARYYFVDDHGHPLENCVEYRELLAEVERLRSEVKRLELENHRLTVAGVNEEAYLLTCLEIIRKAVDMPVDSDWQQVAERVELLDKEADWLAGKLQTLVGPNPKRLESPEPGSMFPKRVVRTWREDARLSVKEEKNG